MVTWEYRLNEVMSECSKHKNWKEMAIQDALRIYARAGEIDQMNEYIKNTNFFSKKGKYRDVQPIYYKEFEILRDLVCARELAIAKELFERFPTAFIEKDIKNKIEEIRTFGVFNAPSGLFNDWFLIATSLGLEDVIRDISFIFVGDTCRMRMRSEHFNEDCDIVQIGFEIDGDDIWWRLASAGKLNEGINLWLSRFFKDAKIFDLFPDKRNPSIFGLTKGDAPVCSGEHRIFEYISISNGYAESKQILDKEEKRIDKLMHTRLCEVYPDLKDSPAANRPMLEIPRDEGEILSLIYAYSRLNDKKALEFAMLIAEKTKPKEEELKGKKVGRIVEEPFRNFIAPVFARFNNIDSGKELLEDGEKLANHFTTYRSAQFKRSWRNIKLYDVMVGYARLGMADDVMRILRKLHGLWGEERFEKFERTHQKPTIFKMAPYQPYCNLQSNDLMVVAYLLYSGFEMKKVALELLEDAYHISFNNLKSWIKEEPNEDTGVVVTPLHHIFEITDQFRKIENDWMPPVLPIYNKLDI
ncbi:MAG: hypothetical protein CVT88_02905 [Candidatus Altiarchaeales archaeon HGW-Altiarchaeales-1]|nr:MAG: hypothetical protein CVT88_02905 [Candidatus Altiarchaeales archaeon HGW-Altiarchaeales-1]